CAESGIAAAGAGYW
nr:immunoglobulin heavy chain junction region [Macaca mulatta]MOV35584.1 immunoglobulin heavy chain junction region [Macaca mulatta]MOV35592.1 immunoglobulin heavy chain junction region [Macaca mulatta]MOV35598.1 immunoglobulin heavy chain junction region [Macaca mulatta]MOV35601.1 immunoglobulin heavy chain junction region [Macaca mulatta]